jgi:hypothetical protein
VRSCRPARGAPREKKSGVADGPTKSCSTSRECRRSGTTSCPTCRARILTALWGHGHFDLAAYDTYLSGRLVDEDVSDERFAQALENLPQVPAQA